MRSSSTQDVLAVLRMTGVTLLAWMMVGWTPDRLLPGFDAVLLFFPWLEEVQRNLGQSGAWGVMSFRPLGGAAFAATTGFPWLMQLPLALGVPAWVTVNLAVLVPQVLVGFFAWKVWTHAPCLTPEQAVPTHATPPPWFQQVACAVFFGFMPLVGWRMAHGHLNLLPALPATLAVVHVYLVGARRVTAVAGFLTVFCVVTALQQQSYQLLLYAVVFGTPLVLLHGGVSPARLGVTAACGLVAVLLAAPQLAVMVGYALSEDSARQLSGASVAFGYSVNHLKDWLGSLVLSLEWVKSTQDNPFFLHETNYPMGTLLALGVVVGARGRRGPLVVWLGLVVLVIMVASDVTPFSQMVTALVPGFHAFRVPARALIMVVPLGLALQLADHRAAAAPAPRHLLVTAAFALLVPFLPDVLVELVCVVAVASLLLPRLGLGVPQVMLVVGLAHVGATGQRMPPYLDAARASGLARILGDAVTAQAPDTLSSLERVYLKVQHDRLNLNTGMAAGLGSAVGYGHPARRYLELFHHATAAAHTPGAMVFIVELETVGTQWFLEMYNMGRVASPTAQGLGVATVLPNARAAWVPVLHHVVEDVGAVARWMAESHSGTRDWHATLLQSAGEETVTTSPECAAMRIQDVAGNGEHLWVTVEAHAPSCPLVFATNHLALLAATGTTTRGETIPLRTFVAYGALLGVVVPPEVTRVDVAPQLRHAVLFNALQAAGALLVLAAWVWRVRVRE